MNNQQAEELACICMYLLTRSGTPSTPASRKMVAEWVMTMGDYRDMTLNALYDEFIMHQMELVVERVFKD